MKTRVIHTKVWEDTWYKRLSPDAKLLWLYVLTNSRINIAGIYELTDSQILFDTSIKSVDPTITDEEYLLGLQMELEPKAFFCKDWVRVVNIDRYNNYKNSPKNLVAYQRELSYIPSDVLEEFGLSIDTSMHTLINKKPEINNQKPEIRNQKPELSASAKELVARMEEIRIKKFAGEETKAFPHAQKFLAHRNKFKSKNANDDIDMQFLTAEEQ